MIREATLEDIPKLIEWGAEFHKLSKHPAPYIPTRVGVFAHQVIESPAGIVLLHDYGFVAGAVTPIWFSDKTQAAEFAWFAEKDGLSLFKAFEQKARELGATYNTMALLENETDNDERVRRIYERLGYRRAETAFIKEL